LHARAEQGDGNNPKIVKFLSAMGLGSLKLNGKSVLVKYDDDLPRERDSNLIRFPLSGNLIKKLCVLWELCER
jgi:hypothetical protein